MITVASAANGFVSIAVTKIEAGFASIAGTLLNGRVRNAVQAPDSSKFSTTLLRSRLANCLLSYLANCTLSLPCTEITTDCSTRLAPRFISLTTPVAGAVKCTPSFFLSENKIWPFFTLSPTLTAIDGRIPTYSSPSIATSEMAGPF